MSRCLLLFLGLLVAAPSCNRPPQPRLQRELPHDSLAASLSPDFLAALAATADLMARLDSAPLLATDSALQVSSREQEETWPFTGTPIGRSLELHFVPAYSMIRFDSGPNVYAVGRLSLGVGRTGYLLRVPGKYSSSSIDLWVLDETVRRFWPPIQVAESWGDAGEDYELSSWLFPTDRDGNRYLVHHECWLYMDIDAGSDTYEVTADNVILRLLTPSGLEPTLHPPSRAFLRPYTSGTEACARA